MDLHKISKMINIWCFWTILYHNAQYFVNLTVIVSNNVDVILEAIFMVVVDIKFCHIRWKITKDVINPVGSQFCGEVLILSQYPLLHGCCWDVHPVTWIYNGRDHPLPLGEFFLVV